MSKTKIAVIATAVTTVFVGWQVLKFYGSEVALMELHPEIDPNLVIAAHRKLIVAIVMNNEPAIHDAKSEADYDAIFLQYVERLKK